MTGVFLVGSTVFIILMIMMTFWAFFPNLCEEIGFRIGRSHAVGAIKSIANVLGLGLVVNGITEAINKGMNTVAITLLFYGILLAVFGGLPKREA